MSKVLIYILTMMLLLTACSSDEGEEVGGQGTLSMVSFTRAGEVTATDDYSPAFLFLVADDASKSTSGQFRYSEPNSLSGSNSLWRSSVMVTNGTSYAIYGYAPAGVGTVTLSDGASTSGATMNFTNLPTVSSQDICFVVGVQQVNNTTDAKDIKLGKFDFTGKSDNNYVNLLMDHVYASICFKVQIDETYAALRGIKLRGMTLQTTKATASAAVTLLGNTTEADPIQGVTYASLAGESREAQFFDNDAGVALTADEALQATCCFVPLADVMNNLTLVTAYDVYDRKGNKISERTATNKLPNISVARGERMTMTLTVSPTYLYVLSDPDLDNPTINIEP